MNRSREPKNARCTTKTGCSWLSAPMYVSPKRAGICASSWIVPSLPRPAERVGRVEVDLRTVERPLPLADEVVDRVALERLDELPFGEVPLRILSELVVRTCRELGARLDAEDVVGEAQIGQAAVELVVDLLARAEDVRVVLGDVPHARQPVQRPGELVAVQRRGLRVADREVAVAVELAAEQHHVARAVHRLDRVGVLLVDRDLKHVLAELLPVPRGHPERLVVDERCLHLGVAPASVLRAPEVLERVEDRHALRVPERRAGRARPRSGRDRAAGRAAGGRSRAPARAARGRRRGPPG